ncbi:exopolysaccharide biosynthesis protein [Paracoccus sp. KR1-242]|uniref:exopolysaccharide biosynthesis protein n=1 Tax=Paracoccus sp. KR1-242 TaxID=3410028 RepID=UPI003BFAC735
MIDAPSDSSEPPRQCGPGDVEPLVPDPGDDPLPEPGPHDPDARQSLSQRLADLAHEGVHQRISMRDLLTLLPGRSLAALILIFAAPNVLPAPPGMSAVLGLPLVYLSYQMMMAQKPWLPPLIAQRSVSRATFTALVRRVTPALAWLERMLRPRLQSLAGEVAQRIVGGLCLLLSLVLVLPVPLGNMLPALAISLAMLGLLGRDGLWVAVGGLVGIVSFVIAVGVVYAMIKATTFLLSRALA